MIGVVGLLPTVIWPWSGIARPSCRRAASEGTRRFVTKPPRGRLFCRFPRGGGDSPPAALVDERDLEVPRRLPRQESFEAGHALRRPGELRAEPRPARGAEGFDLPPRYANLQ